ncbi:sulfatase family protein [Gaetbulibacter saemankumensis]|uniref:sulfatase family protein n=1 Tax=Gaetbulibacter saemankumensis TaxID=311208 RepID=UPI00041260DA|nr:sulfatase [Gaetbulibacter saemankumensis]
MKRLKNLLVLSIVYFSFCNVLHAQTAKKPNILIIIGDDCTYSDLALYGGKNVKTPAIDKLASEGLTFNKAYVTMSMCAPSRSELYTGLQPATNGVCWNHAQARTGTKSIVQYLDKLGYRTGIAGKTHIKPKAVFPFEMVPGVGRNCVSETSPYDSKGMFEFVTRDKSEPFCLVTALTIPHAPWTVGDPSHFDLDALELPPYLVDNKETRLYYAKYLAEIEVFDEQVGKTLDMLKEAGVYDDTIIIFTSEQGAQFPYCKWTNYENGVRTAFVVRWNGVTTPGVRTDALIQYCDVLPTLLEAVGGQSEGFDGTSFLPVLKGEKEKHRDYAYFMHNNVPAGASYPIRSITNGEYHYISNLNSENLFLLRALMAKPEKTGYWFSWMDSAMANQDNLNLVSNYMLRPQEELYKPDDDIHERNNLVNQPEYSVVQNDLSDKLKLWMVQQGDPGASLDSKKEFKAQKKGDHFRIR